MAHVTEFSCGCMVHSLAGTIRKCQGMISFSLSGKPVARDEAAERVHKEPVEVKTYPVAHVIP